jgi:pyrimidine-nucleoside phosphorylase
MVSMGLNISNEEANKLVIKSIEDKSAYNKFLELVKYQGGDINNISISNKKCVIKSNKNGEITKISAIEIGKLALELGAGKKSIKDKIDKLNKELEEKNNIWLELTDIIMNN